MSPAPDDPDFSPVKTLPDSAATALRPSATLDAVGDAIKVTTRDGSVNTSGRTPEDVAAAATAVAQAARTMATNAAIADAAAKILKDAEAAWGKPWSDGGAPKKKDLDDADKAQDDARIADQAAIKATDAARKEYDAAFSAAADDASGGASSSSDVVAAKKKLDDAIAKEKQTKADFDKAWNHLLDLKAKRTAADEAYERARQRAMDKLKTLKPVTVDVSGGTGNGFNEPGGSGSGSGAPAGKGTGNGGTPAVKPFGTPAATPGKTPGTTAPGSATPATTTSSSPTDTADIVKAAVALSQAQQGQQQPQAQQQMPTMPTVPQQATQAQQQPKTGEKGDGKATGAIDVDDLVRSGALPASAAAGLAGLALGGGSPSPVTVGSQAPAGPTTQLRGPEVKIPGGSLGAAPVVNAQVPPTTGTSQTGLHTTSDVGGRPAGTENKPFSAAPDGTPTRTSAATDPAAQQGTGSRTGGAPVAGAPGVGGMPVGGVAAPAASGSRRGGDEERTRIEMYRDEQQYFLNGGDSRSEAVPYTIAQNKPRGDDGPRRPSRAA